MQNQALPQPAHKAVNFDQIGTLDQANDYALAGYHAATSKAEKASGAIARLWEDAASAYQAAYMGIAAIRGLPVDQAMPRARDLLDKANHLADVARTRVA
jgi:hypothetical protein